VLSHLRVSTQAENLEPRGGAPGTTSARGGRDAQTGVAWPAVAIREALRDTAAGGIPVAALTVRARALAGVGDQGQGELFTVTT